MNMNELATLSRHNIPVIEVVVNTMYSVWYASGRHCSMENGIPNTDSAGSGGLCQGC